MKHGKKGRKIGREVERKQKSEGGTGERKGRDGGGMEKRGRKEGKERVKREREGERETWIGTFHYSPLREGNLVVTHNGVVT